MRVRWLKVEAQLTRLEADALQATDAGYARLIAMWKDASALLPGATSERRTLFGSKYSAAEQRVALPIEAERVERALQSAGGYEGLVEIAQLTRSLARASAAPELEAARAGHNERLIARANEIGATVAATERRSIDAIGRGMPGLERGVQWTRDYAERFGMVGRMVEEIAQLDAYFTERRVAALMSSHNDFRAQLRLARSKTEVDQIVGRHLMESDRSTPGGAAILAGVAAQKFP